MAIRADASSTGLVWFRTTLRLGDNTALWHALQENERVFCLYVFDDAYLRSSDIGAARAAFLLESLAELVFKLETHGGQLIVRRAGDVPAAVVRTAVEVGAGRIYVNEDYLPHPIARDKRTFELAAEQRIELKSYQDTLLVHPADVLTKEGRPYTVFTPFKKRWQELLSVPERLEVRPALHRLARTSAPNEPLPTLEDYGLTLKQQIEPGGAKRAQARLAEFASDGLPVYHVNRDACADPNSTSRLSMHIKWGTISLRECYRTARDQGGPGSEKWIDELAWREFFHAILYHFPHAISGPLLPAHADIPWSADPERLEAWKAGRTGYPFVDAGMRQLNATGWMHNRLRQVVASYLCKDLMIHWQEGERYFMQMLVDGDWPANNGGWQWVAGAGADPRRATRIFNPALQQERYDPNAEYVRQWIPEYGTKRYPGPIVPHEEGRQVFLEHYRRARERKRELGGGAGG